MVKCVLCKVYHLKKGRLLFPVPSGRAQPRSRLGRPKGEKGPEPRRPPLKNKRKKDTKKDPFRSLNNNRVALKRPIPSGPRETRLLFCKLLFPFFCGKKGPDTPFFIPFLAGSLATVDGRGPFGPHVKPAKGKKKGVHIFFLLPSRSPQRNPLSRSFPPGVSLRSPGRREVSVGFLWGLNGRRKNEGKEKRTCPPPQRASHAGAGKDGAEVVFPFERVLRPVAAWRLGVLWGRV